MIENDNYHTKSASKIYPMNSFYFMIAILHTVPFSPLLVAVATM